MNKKIALLILLSGCLLPMKAAGNGSPFQLMDGGKPFLMLSGELHNSTSSSLEYLAPIWEKLKTMHLNSVIASISWEQFEPQEGVYDYTIIDGIIRQAAENNMKIAVIWFATWKNGDSSYAPLWVKEDTKRFFRVKNREGRLLRIISPLCREARDADAKAFAALMARIKKIDTHKNVIVMQAENEIGVFQDIDYSEEAQKQFRENVPEKLINYLRENENNTGNPILARWQENGKKTNGNWTQIFGENPDAKEFFMAWQYALYTQEVAKRGKEQHNIPVYLNAWLVQFRDGQPDYPRGGPVSKVIDIYKTAAPGIDWYSPDIYLPNYREICAMYHRPDNPLFIPESTRDAGRAFYAFAEHDAICFAPFGIEDGYNDPEFIAAYGVLDELLPLIAQYQGSGKMHAFYREKNETNTALTMGRYKIDIVYEGENTPAYGLLIQTGDDEFTFAGIGARLHLSAVEPGQIADIATVREEEYENGKQITGRWLNGDETGAHNFIRLAGREGKIKTPGIYQVKMYTFPSR
jgi:beta-galactosidase GanA